MTETKTELDQCRAAFEEWYDYKWPKDKFSETRAVAFSVWQRAWTAAPKNCAKWCGITEEMTIQQMVNRLPMKLVDYIAALEDAIDTARRDMR